VEGRISNPSTIHSINDSIILIENADPGFDWIFTSSIKGLITAYGGMNSHMAVRSGEFGLPCAIGVGQKRFNELKNANRIRLDCLNKMITILS
jgi:phosphoenolpyruvate-protein kinase (PTS system EI component)